MCVQRRGEGGKEEAVISLTLPLHAFDRRCVGKLICSTEGFTLPGIWCLPARSGCTQLHWDLHSIDDAIAAAPRFRLCSLCNHPNLRLTLTGFFFFHTWLNALLFIGCPLLRCIVCICALQEIARQFTEEEMLVIITALEVTSTNDTIKAIALDVRTWLIQSGEGRGMRGFTIATLTLVLIHQRFLLSTSLLTSLSLRVLCSKRSLRSLPSTG